MKNQNTKAKQPEFNPEDKTKVVLDYFSTAKVALLKECNYHPVLVAQINELGSAADWADILAEIAAYANVMLDGDYSQEDLELLYPQLNKRMTDTRLGAGSGIILNSH